MDILELAMQRAAGSGGSGTDAYFSARLRGLAQERARKDKLLGDPDKLDKAVAAVAGSIVPVKTGKFSSSKYNSRVDMMESALSNAGGWFSGKHPMVGAPTEIRDKFIQGLSDKSDKRSIGEILQDNVMSTVATPDKTGMSRIAGSHIFKMQQDTALGNYFGIFGEDEKTKALPGYEEFKQEISNTPSGREHGSAEGIIGLGGAFGVASPVLKKGFGKLAVKAAAKFGMNRLAKWGAGAAAIALAPEIAVAVPLGIAAFEGYELASLALSGSDWGKVREGTWKKAAADLGISMLAGGVGMKLTNKALATAVERQVFSDQAIAMMRKYPVAKNAIAAAEANIAKKKAAKAASDLLVENATRDKLFDSFIKAEGFTDKMKFKQAFPTMEFESGGVVQTSPIDMMKMMQSVNAERDAAKSFNILDMLQKGEKRNIEILSKTTGKTAIWDPNAAWERRVGATPATPIGGGVARTASKVAEQPKPLNLTTVQDAVYPEAPGLPLAKQKTHVDEELIGIASKIKGEVQLPGGTAAQRDASYARTFEKLKVQYEKLAAVEAEHKAYLEAAKTPFEQTAAMNRMLKDMKPFEKEISRLENTIFDEKKLAEYRSTILNADEEAMDAFVETSKEIGAKAAAKKVANEVTDIAKAPKVEVPHPAGTAMKETTESLETELAVEEVKQAKKVKVEKKAKTPEPSTPSTVVEDSLYDEATAGYKTVLEVKAMGEGVPTKEVAFFSDIKTITKGKTANEAGAMLEPQTAEEVEYIAKLLKEDIPNEQAKIRAAMSEERNVLLAKYGEKSPRYQKEIKQIAEREKNALAAVEREANAYEAEQKKALGIAIRNEKIKAARKGKVLTERQEETSLLKESAADRKATAKQKKSLNVQIKETKETYQKLRQALLEKHPMSSAEAKKQLPLLAKAEDDAIAKLTAQKKAISATTVDKKDIDKLDELFGSSEEALNSTVKVFSADEIKAVEAQYKPKGSTVDAAKKAKKMDSIMSGFLANGGKWGIGLTTATAILMPYANKDTAEANVALDLGKIIVPEVMEGAAKVAGEKGGFKGALKYLEEAMNKHYISRPVDPAKPFTLPTAMRAINMARTIATKYGSIDNALKNKKALPWGLGNIVTPHTAAHYFYATDALVTPQLAHMQAAIRTNVANALTVVKNILGEVPMIKAEKAAATIAKEMEPLANEYAKPVLYGQVTVALKTKTSALERLERQLAGKKAVNVGTFEKARERLEKQLIKDGVKDPEKIKKIFARLEEQFTMRAPVKNPEKIRAAIEMAKGKITELQKTADDLRPLVEKFHTDWTTKMQDLSSRFSSTRIALAIEDEGFKKYPWLAGKLSVEEKAAVARMKTVLGSYKERMMADKHNVIAEDYMHHVFHPTWREENLMKLSNEMGVDHSTVTYYRRFHARSQHSLQMVPDVGYIMSKYIPDAEKRINWSSFWDFKDKQGWGSHANGMTVQGNAPLRKFWNKIKDSAKPTPSNTLTEYARLYASLEVARLLAFSPSVALKHLFKVTGTWSTQSFSHNLTSAKEAMGISWRNMRNTSEIAAIGKKFGLDTGTTKKVWDDFADSYINQGHTLSNIMDMNLEHALDAGPGMRNKFNSFLDTVNTGGSAMLRAVEYFDRIHTFTAAMNMASKKGMTIEQATYGFYSNLVKINFVGGILNASWMNNPGWRAVLLFQNTPFKIMERRLIAGYHTGKAVKLSIGGFKTKLKGEGIQSALKELAEVRHFIRNAETDIKGNMIIDALKSEKDFFGSTYSSQVMRELLYSGMLIGGGYVAGANLSKNVWHLPFLAADKTDPTVMVSPVASAAYKMGGNVLKEGAHLGDDDEFFVSRFYRDWMGLRKDDRKSLGVIPYTMRKMIRLNKNDIPKMYNDSWVKYMFAVPAIDK